MKRFLLILCIFIQLFLLSGCSNDPFVVFSTQDPHNGLSLKQTAIHFNKDERIYYAVVAPKGFKYDTLKIQLVKKDPKSEFWGFTNYRNKTVRLGSEKYYSDYFVLRESGIYVLQAFNLINLQKPIATGMFRIDD